MGATRARAEVAADLIAAAARQAEAGARLGSREELRQRCEVSVGTLHEALRLLQATGEIVVRPGPGGGVFAGEKSALTGMLRDVQRAAVPPDLPQLLRVLDALVPLVVEDAVRTLDEPGTRRLRDSLAALTDTATGTSLRDVVRASLEVFATVVSLPPTGILAVMVSSLLRTQVAALPDVVAAIDPDWRGAVDQHVDAVSRLVDALVAADAAAALRTCRTPEFMGVFAAVATPPELVE